MVASKSVKERQLSAFIFFAALLVTFFVCSPALARVEANFLFNLSDFSGTLPLSGGKLAVDYERDETYVLWGDIVRVFNEAGMEIFSFTDADTDLGVMRALVVLPEGDMITLSFNNEAGRVKIMRRNYRGEPISEIKIKGLPSELSQFSPYLMKYNKESLYFADPVALAVVVTDVNGVFKQQYDLLPLLELQPKDRGEKLMTGFDVSRDGDILFTITVLFEAYVVSPDGKLRRFGQAGSLPGRFNLVAGITSDSRGDYLVTDQLKGAVQVFDKGFNFLALFGNWGGKPGTLLMPEYIAVNRKDIVFVSSKNGVSVYRLIYSE